MGRISSVVSVGSLSLDIANTWTVNNSNTNRARMIKTGIQITGFSAGVGVGFLALAAANCWNPVGWTAGAAVATYIGVSFIGSMLISKSEDWAYKKLEIE